MSRYIVEDKRKRGRIVRQRYFVYKQRFSAFKKIINLFGTKFSNIKKIEKPSIELNTLFGKVGTKGYIYSIISIDDDNDYKEKDVIYLYQVGDKQVKKWLGEGRLSRADLMDL